LKLNGAFAASSEPDSGLNGMALKKSFDRLPKRRILAV